MRLVFLFIIIGTISPCAAFSASPPLQFPASANKLEDFLPEGWRIKSIAKGDLNKDDLDDYALMAQFGSMGLLDPELLIIESGNDKCYRLKVHRSFDNPSELEIRGNVLSIIWPWYGIGRAQTDHSIKVRKYKNSEHYRIIGEDSDYYDSFKMEGQTYSANYIIGLRIIEYYHWGDEKKVIDDKLEEKFAPDVIFVEDYHINDDLADIHQYNRRLYRTPPH